MTIAELAKYSGVSEKLIYRDLDKIPGLIKENESISFAEGSRYPFNPYRYKFDNAGKRYCALLEATYRYQFIDHKMLQLTKPSFDTMLRDLDNAGYIQQNGSNNTLGANRYDVTSQYLNIRAKRIEKRIKIIVEAVTKAGCCALAGVSI